MNKKLSRLLSLILVLCMIPATVITAFARGKGVYSSGRENQSIHYADGQPIPETIVVDGYLNDTGWNSNLWNYVDSSTGHWNTKTLAGNNGDATYKYQMRADYEQLYFGASVLLPKDVTEGRIRLWFKEEGHTNNDGVETKGYSDLITLEFDASGDGDPVMTSTVSDVYNKGDKKSTEDNAHPAQISKIIGKKSVVDGRIAVDLEFNNLLGHIFETNLNNVAYYVSLELKNGGVDSNNEPAYDRLYHPKYFHSEGANLPTSEYWPTDASGKVGGTHLDTSLISTTAPKSEITVDGNFDEAIWSSLVDENGDFESLSGDTTYGTGVKNHDNVFFITDDDDGFDANYNSNDPDGNRQHIRFKYEVRVDGEYLYGAVVAYVPPIIGYTVNGNDINTSPDLTVNFFDDVRCQYPEGFVTGQGEETEKVQSKAFTGYQPEALLQIRSQYSKYIEGDPTYGNVFYTFANIWPEAKNKYGHLEKVGWGSGLLDYDKPEELSATRVAREGNLWNFEFRILLSAVPVDSNGNIAFSIALYDRYHVDNDGKERFLAYTGVVSDNESYSVNVPQYDYAKNQKNIISAAQIASAKDLEIAKNYDFSDGVLDQNLWTALSAADDVVDGRERNSTSSPATSFTHKLTADHEYLYGALILKGDSWTADDYVRIWPNRKKTESELKESTSTELNIESYSGQKYYTGETYDTVLNDGKWDKDGTLGPGPEYRGDGKNFAAYVTSAPLEFKLDELYAVDYVTVYMSGGNDAADRQGQWGIYVSNGVSVEYSEDGVNYTAMKSGEISLTTKRIGEDKTFENSTTGNPTWFDAWQFDIDFKKHVSARYFRLTFKPIAGVSSIWFSEVDFFGTEAHGMYYALTMYPEVEDYRFISCNSKYLDGHNANQPDKVLEDGSFDYAVTEIDPNTRAVEFRVSLETLGIKYDLSALPEDELFYYYVSVDRDKVGALIYPRNNTGRTPHRDNSTNWFMDEVYDGALKFSYGDVKNAISVDGKLDERLWLGDDVIMEHVDSTKGTWASQPKYGNSLEYDYVIYAGNNYLYGAAIIDESAVVSKEAYQYTGIPQTRFEIWIDNGIDEVAWMTDNNDKTNINVKSEKKSFTVDDKGVLPNGWNGDRQWEVTYFLNYYYNIYLVDEATTVPSAAGDKYVCGGSAPMNYTDPKKSLGEDGLTIPINTQNWRWGMTTVNGKTYVEFIIDLDNFYCDRSKGLNYYVSVTHAYGTETATTADDETLSLYSPKIDGTVANSSPLWVTHINSMYPEGGGVIFTKDYIDANDGKDTYWGADSKAWWAFILFTPVDASKNEYKVKAIRDGYGDNKYGSPFRKSDLSAGDFVYGFNHGNDWIYVKAHPESAAAGTDLASKANINFVNTDALQYHTWARALKVGDEVKFNFDKNVTLTGTTVTVDTDPLATQTAYNYKSVAGIGTTTSVKWYEPAYICKSTVTLTKKADQTAEIKEYAMKAPSTGTWYAEGAGKIEILSHFNPEKITIDGDVNEPGWDSDKWISVVENVNGKLTGESAHDGTDRSSRWFYQYQLRTDGEYLYVGVKYNDVAYDTLKPNFTLWLKTDNTSETWTHFYSVGYIDNNAGVAALDASDLLVNYPLMDGKELEIIGPVGNVGAADTLINYKNMVNFVENTSKTAVGAYVGKNLLYRCSYGESALFGYTKEVQENATSGIYNPDIRTTKLYLGKECAVMQNSASNSNSTVVEFKVALSEFGGNNGFEYFVEAQFGDFDVVYPMCYTESASSGVDYQENLPMWNWSEKTSEKVTKSDIQSGEIRLRDNAMPVVTLGAKISENYVASDGEAKGHAIRMGAVYNETYLRNWRSEDKNKLDPSDELYTSPANDYWDVADLGIVMLPTQLLGADQQLTLETPRVVALSADNIIKWVNDAESGGWSNFADYENFVFYATLYGLPSDAIKVSFRGYVDFYASTGTDSYYDHTMIRSYEMVENIVGDESWIPEN